MKTLNEHTIVASEERAILEQCRDAVKALDSAAELLLYGSRARGDAERDSDYDLLIVTDAPSTLEREEDFRRSIYPIELETGAVLTVMLVSRADWNSPLYDSMPFYRAVKREGIIL